MSEHAHNPESRFALMPHGDELALFQPVAGALRWMTSRDGLEWHEQEQLTVPAGMKSLHPLCVLSDSGNSLLCREDSGALVKVEIGGNELRMVERLASLPEPGEWYEPGSGRTDLTIVRAGASGYRAFFGARRRSGRDTHRLGCIGTAHSDDLRSWEMEPPIFAPNLCARLHSPRLFHEPGRAVLFYGTPEEGGHHAVRCALGQSADGPFERIDQDILANDLRGAIHTAIVRGRRLAFFERHDSGHATELTRPAYLDFHPNGRPFLRMYDGLLKLLGRGLFETDATLSSGEALVRVLPRMGKQFRYQARVRSRGATGIGLLFRTSMTGHENMTVWLEFDAGAVTLRRGVHGRIEARSRRPLDPAREHALSIWVEGRYADVYLDEEWVLTGRSEGRQSGGFGLAVRGGEARFEKVIAQPIGNGEN